MSSVQFDPNYFTQAGPVTVRQADGSTTELAAYDPQSYQRLVKVRGHFSPKMRAAIMRRDRGACRYCGSTSGPWEMDHVVPIALGGSNRIKNLVLACQDCNGRKKAEVWKPRPHIPPADRQVNRRPDAVTRSA